MRWKLALLLRMCRIDVIHKRELTMLKSRGEQRTGSQRIVKRHQDGHSARLLE